MEIVKKNDKTKMRKLPPPDDIDNHNPL